MTQRTPFHSLPTAQQAGMICNHPRFSEFIKSHFEFQGEAASFVRGWCDIASRRELNTNTAAAKKFGQLHTEFDAWTGKIPTPRLGEHS